MMAPKRTCRRQSRPGLGQKRMSEGSHGSPVEGSSCACCWDDITSENYVEYRSFDSSSAHSSLQWLPSGYCQACVEQLIKTQWYTYVSSIEKSTCRAEMKRLLARGPPVNVRDPKAMPCPDEREVAELWYISDGAVHDAKLEGSLTGEAREAFWKEKLEFFLEDEGDEQE